MDEPAFPHVNFVNQKISGMTLRDYFAAKVLAGYFSNNHPNELEELGLFDTETYNQIAVHAYEMANAMLEARKK